MRRLSCLPFILIVASSAGVADSGGRLIPEQAAYDVKSYSLNLRIDPGTKTVSGFVEVDAIATDSLSHFVLDLDDTLTVDSVRWKSDHDTLLPFRHTKGRIWITLPRPLAPGEMIKSEVYYHGNPEKPPPERDFVWLTTAGGEPWAGVSCEFDGGDVWWPCKDHPSDEPDSVSLNFTVPGDLVCVSNGKLVATVTNRDGTKTYQWFVSNPINNYDVTFYLGPYERIPADCTSITGEKIPAEYWFLREDREKGRLFIPLFLEDLRFLEETCGPFPFRADKYGVAESMFGAMEHQTIISIGDDYNLNADGFCYNHFHELAHEWWGNMVTAKDWSDVWLHEGFACYMEALYAEHLNGPASYKSYMAGLRNFWDDRAVAPRETLSACEGYKGPVYDKGAWILHTLRHLVGDTVFFRLLHRWAYPDPAMEHVTDGRQCRLATTDDFLRMAEKVSGLKLGWFFEAYLRQAPVPLLSSGMIGDTLLLRWHAPKGLPFYLPVDVKVGERTIKVDMKGGTGRVVVPRGVQPEIDPDNWTLHDISPALSASPPCLNFGDMRADSTRTDSLLITNTWIAPVKISSVSTDLSELTVMPPGATIAPSMSQKFYATLKPLHAGIEVSRIVFTHDGPGSPLTVAATGMMGRFAPLDSLGHPMDFALGEAVVNSSNSLVTIPFAIPRQSDVKLTVYDSLIKSITNLVDGVKPAGLYTAVWDAKGLPDGRYYYGIAAGNFIRLMKVEVKR